MILYENDYLEFHPYAHCIFSEKRNLRHIKVYYESKSSIKEYSRFALFCGKIYFGDLEFPTYIDEKDIILIARHMAKEFCQSLKTIDDKDMERNFVFFETSFIWNKMYGFGTEYHKKSLQLDVTESIENFLEFAHDDVELVMEVIEYIKEYSPKKCKNLFK